MESALSKQTKLQPQLFSSRLMKPWVWMLLEDLCCRIIGWEG